MADPVLWTLAGTTAATVYYLLDRRAKGRPTALDDWAMAHRMPLVRDVSLSALSALEPLGLLPTVIAVDRLAQGTLRTDEMAMAATMAVCLVGKGRKSRRFLLGAFGGHPDLPALRILPKADDDAPRDLGFVEMPAAGVPSSYRVESFQPLRSDITEAIGSALLTAGPEHGFRLELRSGRILIATPHAGGASPDALLGLGVELGARLYALLGPPAEPPVREDKAGCGGGGCGSCGGH